MNNFTLLRSFKKGTKILNMQSILHCRRGLHEASILKGKILNMQSILKGTKILNMQLILHEASNNTGYIKYAINFTLLRSLKKGTKILLTQNKLIFT